MELFTNANLKPTISPQQDVKVSAARFMVWAWISFEAGILSSISLFPTGITVTPLEERNGWKQLLQCLFEGKSG